MELLIAEMKRLIDFLNCARNEYYNNNNSIITDESYDARFDRLSCIEKETGIMMSSSPTQRVGFEVKSKLQKVKHITPLKSLDETKSIEELSKFIGNNEVLLMLKVDGLTVELNYNNGELILASTRGDSETGEDITHNALMFENIPLNIPYGKKLRLVGEAFMTYDNFEEIKANMRIKGITEDKLPKTPRNLTSGSVRQLDSQICKNRHINFIAFGLLESDKNFTNKTEELLFLRSLGFLNMYGSLVQENTIEGLKEETEIGKDLAEELNIPIDGLVCTYNNLLYANSCGSTSHHPLHSLAFKFTDEQQTTYLISVQWQVGRTGVITPVAIFKPVELDGTEVKQASLHNISIIESLELGIGDEIEVYKANQIIPQVKLNNTKSNDLHIPEHCPICFHETVIEQLNDSKTLNCTNKQCPAKILQQFNHFVSRGAMNIEGLSESTLEKFINSGYISNFFDIYTLNKFENEIVNSVGFGKKSWEKLLKAIETSKKVDLQNFIFALGIDQIGIGGSKKLVKYFNNDIEKIKNATYEQLLEVDDFGHVTAMAVYDYLNDDNNINTINKLLTYISINKMEILSNKKLEGKIFVITGSFENFKPRKKLETLIESLGGKCQGSVSKNTNFLINNDIASTSGKNKDAKELCVKIITEEEFLEMIK